MMSRPAAITAVVAKRIVAAPVLSLLLMTAAQPTAAQDDPRGQLAIAYLRLELALADAPPLDTAARARVNREFDRSTFLFFAGNMQGVLGVIDSMVAALPGSGDALTARAAARLDSLTAARRVEAIGGNDIPYLLHVPTGAAPAAGWPVVLAVHGAGGDERMFFGGYGAGSIRDIADRHRVAVISPGAPLSTDGLFGLVDALAPRHSLDVSRVALLGHSMGAAVVSRAAGERPERTRAVACIAGSCVAAGASGAAGADAVADTAAAVPVMVLAGALYPLFRAAGLEEQAAALRRDGRIVEFRRYDAEGHTLVVGQALPGVMQWLAERLR
jgi:predicted esterase